MHTKVLAMVINNSENRLKSFPVEIWILIIDYVSFSSYVRLLPRS
jgi:hypothetical protein